MKRLTIFAAAVLFVICAGNPITGIAADTKTSVTSVTDTIAQLNYGDEGHVRSFLLGTNILLSFPSNVCGGIETLGAPGNSVTYSGTAVTTESGFESVLVSSFTNNTTNAKYSAPSSAAYGPTSGSVVQLNYADGGAIDGFVFTAGGSTPDIFVFTGTRASSVLTPLLTVGTTVSVTGETSSKMSGCALNGALEAVDARSLTFKGQTVVIPARRR